MAFGLPSAFLDTLFLVGFIHFKETAESHIQLYTLFEHCFMFPRLRFPFCYKISLLCLFPLPFPVDKAIDIPPCSRDIVFIYSHLNHVLSAYSMDFVKHRLLVPYKIPICFYCNILFYEKM